MTSPVDERHPDTDDPSTSDAASLQGEYDIELAKRAVQVHCVVDWPTSQRCNNCHGTFPCVTHQWGVNLLSGAGWSAEQIALLDRRLGPWS